MTYSYYRFLGKITDHTVWLYHVSGLSLRDVELLPASLGIAVTYDSIRHWCYGPTLSASCVDGAPGRTASVISKRFS